MLERKSRGIRRTNEMAARAQDMEGARGEDVDVGVKEAAARGLRSRTIRKPTPAMSATKTTPPATMPASAAVDRPPPPPPIVAVAPKVCRLVMLVPGA